MQEIGGNRLNSYFSFAGSPKRRIQIEIAIKDKGIVLRVEGQIQKKKKMCKGSGTKRIEINQVFTDLSQTNYIEWCTIGFTQILVEQTNNNTLRA